LKLPKREMAQVEPQKLTEYLLSTTHAEGKDKAAFFTRFGFSIESWEVFADALRQHADSHDLTKIAESRFGARYVIEGTLRTPDGRDPVVRSVWFIARDQKNPRLVTAYPLDE